MKGKAASPYLRNYIPIRVALHLKGLKYYYYVSKLITQQTGWLQLDGQLTTHGSVIRQQFGGCIVTDISEITPHLSVV